MDVTEIVHDDVDCDMNLRRLFVNTVMRFSVP
jgi:hypothetical protein